MAEKGGKGFKASSLKTPSSKDATWKGKDDDSEKSKRGRKVQFNNEAAPDVNAKFSSKSWGKPETPIGEWLKGGKGGKTANGVKSSVPKEPPKYELNVEKELPSGAQCVMDCEAADILQGIQEHMVILSRDPMIKIPVSFDRGLQYAKSEGRYTDPQGVRQVLDRTLKNDGVSAGEICLIANVCPETIDEVFALVPSLKAKRSELTEPVKDVLMELAKLKCSTENFKM
ncbi:hypothetical protein Ancab_033341 [Ancistrocladus abbreviatus]